MNSRDRDLVRRMLQGEESAFDEFFDGYFPGLYRFALGRLHRDEAAAEEVAQATICKAITKLQTYRGEAALFSWLCTFCRHEISAYYRSNKVSRGEIELIEDAPDVRAALESLGANIDAPDAALGRREVGRLVQVTLDQLPTHYGDILEWKYMDEMTVKQIAERLNTSAKAAESQLTRARVAFRDAFQTLTGAAISRIARLEPKESSL